jgi:ATP-dependent DNA helicase RecQ
MFADDSFAATEAPLPRRSRLTDTVLETLHFFRQGRPVSEISRIRGMKDSTIITHLEESMLAGETIDLRRVVSDGGQREIGAALARYGFGNLGGVVESLAGKYSYGQCRLVRAALQVQKVASGIPA